MAFIKSNNDVNVLVQNQNIIFWEQAVFLWCEHLKKFKIFPRMTIELKLIFQFKLDWKN